MKFLQLILSIFVIALSSYQLITEDYSYKILFIVSVISLLILILINTLRIDDNKPNF